jgi:hypothetical protein
LRVKSTAQVRWSALLCGTSMTSWLPSTPHHNTNRHTLTRGRAQTNGSPETQGSAQKGISKCARNSVTYNSTMKPKELRLLLLTRAGTMWPVLFKERDYLWVCFPGDLVRLNPNLFKKGTRR